MATEDSKRLRVVYAGALQRDPEERTDYLREVCAGQPELRAKVEALLQAHSQEFAESEAVTRSVSSDGIEGKVIGPYIVERELGRGGMGVVYLADDTRLSRRVALKAVAPAVSRDLSQRERLRHEARAAAALSHPGIATVYALEEIGDDLYLAYEYVPGVPLRTLLASGPLPIGQVVAIGVQLARALAAAHTVGVIHRDIKPENVMKTPSGVVKILDFGLARMETAPTTVKLTQTGVVVGTPAYMAPEQVLGGNVDFRTDLFAFGLLIYELVSGVNPFAAKTVTGTFARIVEHDPPVLSSVRPQTVPGLDRIVSTCLRKDPVERYDSTQDLVADFEELEMEAARLRQADSDRMRYRPAAAAASHPGWWRVHQVTVIGLYLVAAALGWQIKEWIKVPVTVSVFLALGSGAAIGGVLRGHLVFTELVNERNLAVERRRTARAQLVVDLLMACALIVDAVMLIVWPVTAVLTIALGIGIALTALVLEPATMKARLGEGD